MITIDTYYKIFKITDISVVSKKELKRRYRILVRKYHPDKGGTDDHFRLIQNAYEYLEPKCQEKAEVKEQKKPQPKLNPKKSRFLYYSDGSIYDVKKARWKQLRKYGIWFIWNYKYNLKK